MKHQTLSRKKHLCETAIQLSLCEFKKKLQEDKYLIAIFLYLKEAIKTVDRNILFFERVTQLDSAQSSKAFSNISNVLEADIPFFK